MPPVTLTVVPSGVIRTVPVITTTSRPPLVSPLFHRSETDPPPLHPLATPSPHHHAPEHTPKQLLHHTPARHRGRGRHPMSHTRPRCPSTWCRARSPCAHERPANQHCRTIRHQHARTPPSHVFPHTRPPTAGQGQGLPDAAGTARPIRCCARPVRPSRVPASHPTGPTLQPTTATLHARRILAARLCRSRQYPIVRPLCFKVGRETLRKVFEISCPELRTELEICGGEGRREEVAFQRGGAMSSAVQTSWDDEHFVAAVQQKVSECAHSVSNFGERFACDSCSVDLDQTRVWTAARCRCSAAMLSWSAWSPPMS